MGAAAGVASAQLTDKAEDGTNTLSYTFPSLSFGSPNGNRYIIAFIWWQGSFSSRTLDSVTIGGETAEIHIQRSSDGGVNPAGAAIASVHLPLGTTGTITLTLSGTCNIAGLSVARGLNLRTGTDYHANSAGLDNENMSLNIPPHGLGLGISAELDESGTFTITGLTEADDYTVGGGGGSVGIGISEKMDEETARTINFNSSGSSVVEIATVCASFE